MAVRDLHAAASQMWEECGLASAEGGVHPGWGTGNRVIPLGFAYLELLGIVDADLALGSDVGRWIQQVSSDGDRLAAWSVEVDDLDEVARRLGLEVASGGRLRPDGRRLSFRLAGVEVARQRPWLPFFVAWDHAAMRPSPQEVSHRLEVQDLSWVEVSGDPTELEWWLGGARLPVRF
ncbi:MAG: VOC family protein, partial [Actinomycetota bacterium]|nr:VOC family protein [Actinomycetota bacterium]